MVINISNINHDIFSLWLNSYPSVASTVFSKLLAKAEPLNKFSYPEEPLGMKTFTGQTKLIVGTTIEFLLNMLYTYISLHCKE